MKKYSKKEAVSPEEKEVRSVMEEVIRNGAQKMLMSAIQIEVDEFIEKHSGLCDEKDKRIVARNGSLPGREILTGIGPIPVKQPRVDDRKIRKSPKEAVFSSKIVPRYMRRIASIDKLIPILYLKGISTGDFSEALSAILGKKAKGLSASTVVRLKAQWETEYKEWSRRDLHDKRYVYFWADGVYFNIRLEGGSFCILVIIGADKFGNKELVAVSDGVRESSLSWKSLLLDLKERGLKEFPKLATGDGSMGFWKALEEVCPETKEQRCWVHKTANILDKVPKAYSRK